MNRRTSRLCACGALLLALCLACGLPDMEGLERPGFELKVADGPCLLDDVDGDGVGDLGVLLYNDYEQQRPAILSGASGDVIWETTAYQGAGTATMCVGSSHFAVTAPNQAFRLDLYAAAREPAVQRLDLSDRPFRYGTAPGCFTLRTMDQQAVGFRLESPVVRGSCPAPPSRVTHDYSGTAESRDDPVTTTHGGITYEISFRERGTELIRVSRQGGWTRELPLVVATPGYRAGILAVPDGVIVVGQPHPEVEDVSYVVFLAAADGAERHRVTFRDRLTTGVGHFVFNGRYAVIKLGNTVRAYDPASGAEAWAVGYINPISRR